MEHQFWHKAWEQATPGWQQSETNQHLQQHWQHLDKDKTAQVFVPLCGNSIDLQWLRDQGHSVLGVELSRKAIEQFFADRAIQVQPRLDSDFAVYQADGYQLLAGDFFSLTPGQLAETRLVYDRAALVALPPAMRQKYVEHMARILPSHCEMLLLTMEYDGEPALRPPFSVLEQEVRRIYAPYFEIELRDRWRDSGPIKGRFKERGVTRIEDCIYTLRKIA